MVRLRSLRPWADRSSRALVGFVSLASSWGASGCITSLGQVSGNAETSATSDEGGSTGVAQSTTSSGTSSGDGRDSASGTTVSSTSGNASDDALDESSLDGGEGVHFDIGGAGERGGSSSDSGATADPPDPPPANDGDCCVPADGTGCGDAVLAACVCADDPYCCDTAWDELCIAEVDSLGCGACGAIGPAGFGVFGECCAAHEEAGCTDETIASCVCATDPYCCMVVWDQVCVDEIAQYGCGDCDAGTTGAYEGSSSGGVGSSSGTG